MNKNNLQVLFLDIIKIWIGFNIGFIAGAFWHFMQGANQ